MQFAVPVRSVAVEFVHCDVVSQLQLKVLTGPDWL